MKNLLLIAVSAIILFTSCTVSKPLTAEEKKQEAEKYYVHLTLKSGKTIKGYLESSFIGEAYNVKISSTPGETPVSYSTNEIKKLVYPATQSDPNEVVWYPVKGYKYYKFKMYEQPVMMKLVYDGKSVLGYEKPTISVNAHTPNAGGMGMSQRSAVATAYYYYIESEGVAIPYYFNDPISSPIGVKSSLKRVFKEYPSVMEGLNNNTINLKKDHLSLIKLMDKDLSAKK